MKFTPNLTKNQWKYGMIVMILCLLALPNVLTLFCYGTLNAAQINFTTYFITAAASVYVLRSFLKRNLLPVLARPIFTVYYACLGYLAQLAMGSLLAVGIYAIAADFINLNDETVGAMLQGDPRLIIFTVVVLAPIVEECLYRGLLFRGIYDRSPILAWSLSVGLFAASHVVGYLGLYSPLALAISFVQYLPAGIVLCITYQKTGTIMGPMLTHAIINFMAVYATTR